MAKVEADRGPASMLSHWIRDERTSVDGVGVVLDTHCAHSKCREHPDLAAAATGHCYLSAAHHNRTKENKGCPQRNKTNEEKKRK